MRIDLSNLGLRPETPRFLAETPRVVPPEWKLPPYLDLRNYCLPADDQGNHPFCAAHATGGKSECVTWRRTHIPVQADASLIYAGAKEIDGDTEPGTSLESAVKSAIRLGYFPPATTMSLVRTADELKFALHTYDHVICGFNITEDWAQTDSHGFIGTAHTAPLGGHAVLCASWHSANADFPENFGWQNSWGQWGISGFGRMTLEQFSAQFLYGIVLRIPEEP